MRPDVKALLARLGQRDFQYREFADPIADVERWPMFAVILEDERVVGRGKTEDHAQHAPKPTHFLNDYTAAPGGNAPAERHGGSLRAFLSGLSDKGGEHG